MADPKKKISDEVRRDFQASVDDQEFGIGSDAEGNIRTFPASELNARVAQRDRDEAAANAVINEEEGETDDEPE